MITQASHNDFSLLIAIEQAVELSGSIADVILVLVGMAVGVMMLNLIVDQIKGRLSL